MKSKAECIENAEKYAKHVYVSANVCVSVFV